MAATKSNHPIGQHIYKKMYNWLISVTDLQLLFLSSVFFFTFVLYQRLYVNK